MRVLGINFVAWLALATAASGAELHVPGQYATIAEALGRADAGDSIVVACGTYVERQLVMKSGVVLRSDTGDPSCVTIDARGLGRVMLCYGVNEDTRIEGITIRGGHVRGYPPFFWGAGMLCQEGSAPQIVRCVFENNVTDFGYGGALACQSSSPRLVDCIFRDNRALGDSDNFGVGGAVVYLDSWSVLERCVFVGNSANDDGGAVYSKGTTLDMQSCTFLRNAAGRDAGGMLLWTGDATIDGCEFLGNYSGRNGGGLAVRYSSSSLLHNCEFDGNEASLGGGISCSNGSTPVITNCRFVSNSGRTSGGACYNSGLTGEGSAAFEACLFISNSAGHGGAATCFNASASTFTNCTFANNSASWRGTAVALVELIVAPSPVFDRCIFAFHPGASLFYCGMGDATLRCCDVFGNGGGDWTDWCIADEAGLNGNFSDDPLFCNPVSGDYRLRTGSPCLPEASSECGLIGALDQGCGPTAVRQRTWGTVKALFGTGRRAR